MFGRSKTCNHFDGVVSVRIEQWEKLRQILSSRYNKPVDDKQVMMYILSQGSLVKTGCKYGVFFDIDGENVILEV